MGITDGMYQLGHAAHKLNQGSDELNQTLGAIDEVLSNLGIGMEHTLARPLHEDVAIGPDHKRVIRMGFLAYGRHKGRFRLLYKTIKVLEDRKAMASEGPGTMQPLLEAPRRIRHLAIDQLPDLVGGLANSVDDVLNQLERRKQVASNVLEQLQQMLSDTQGGGGRVPPSPTPPGGPLSAAPSGKPERPRRRTAAGHMSHKG